MNYRTFVLQLCKLFQPLKLPLVFRIFVYKISLTIYSPSVNRLMEEGRSSVPNRQGAGRGARYAAHTEDDIETTIQAFRKPRNCLLVIVTHFYSECHKRLKILRKIIADPSFRIPQLLDPKTHNVSKKNLFYSPRNNTIYIFILSFF